MCSNQIITDLKVKFHTEVYDMKGMLYESGKPKEAQSACTLGVS